MFRRAVRVVSMSSVLFLAAATVPAWADDAGTETPVTDPSGGVTTADTAAPAGDATDTTDAGAPATTEAPPGDTSAPDTSAPDTSAPADPATPATDTPGSATGQTVTVTDVAVAVADSGNNQMIVNGGGAATGTAGTGVTSGPATAIGSQDTTSVSQQASATLSGNATAEITQVVFVFNLGVAGATSGANVTGTGAGAGVITTGSAAAVGNSGSNYVTQAGAADATATPSAATSQVSITVRVGVAVANSGANDVSGSATVSAGQVASGAATAVGNNSTTDITQTASATGSGSAHLVIGQQAVVVNIGVSLANSGLNGGIGDLVTALLNAPDSNAATELFTALLPALFGSYAAASSGAGTVATGAATAIGNNSATYIGQTATATAAGDGSATVLQDASVGNVGAAVANTGLNGTGASASPVALDAASQLIVSQLAAYLSSLLTAASTWSPGDPAPTIPGALTLSNGTVNLDVGGSVSGSQIDVGSADPTAGGPHATIRQIVAVFSLGVSSANSGSNTATVDVGVTDDGSFVVAPAGTITTGDVVATNSGTIVVCQRANEPTAPCLQPPTDPVVEPPFVRPPTVDPAVSSSGTLPVTGSDAELMLAIALALLLIGTSLTLSVRRSATR